MADSKFQDETLQEWGRKLNKIVITRAIEYIYQKILERNVIVIVGPTGSGKSTIAYYAAFRLQKESGYTIIPARQSVDITNYYVQGTKQVFIIDNFIGQYTVDETDVGIWGENEPVLKMILSKNDDTKLILTSRTYIWQPEQYSCLSLDACMCDLLSDPISLLLTERRGICQSYLNQDEVKALKDETLLMKGHIEIVQNLIKNKSIIDFENNEGLKPFVYACENNATAVAKVLLHHCGKWINVNEKYKKRNNGSVLHIVCAKGFVNLVLLLLQNNANIDIQDGSGCTPLHVANSSAVAKALLDGNANINQVDFFGRSPLYIACSTKQERVAKLLIEKKAEINQKAKTESRPLHAACQSESIEIVKILVENGATINSAKPGISPLHEACRVGNESIVNFLIESNASINHKTKDGLTPLHEACIHGHINVTRILLKSKANVNEANKYGSTALSFSNVNGFSTVVDLLLQHGATVNVCDEDKLSPLMSACEED
ncbi:ankyrin-1-like [Mytilus trossulus]|uniref:ankyrin-1-like n=1 Tax=Mytilus trossulus TaxID=6551 RepID=UPI00300625D3